MAVFGVALAVSVACVLVILALIERRLAALEARVAKLAETLDGAAGPGRVALPADAWRGSIGVGWGRPRLVASRRDGMFGGGDAA